MLFPPQAVKKWAVTTPWRHTPDKKTQNPTPKEVIVSADAHFSQTLALTGL
jgi:hypothetical protein